jgi:hypothetical protein
MALEGALAGVPGLRGYLAGEDRLDRQVSQRQAQAIGLMGMLQRQQELEQQAQLAPLKEAFMKAQAEQMAAHAASAQRKEQFFSPQNMAQFMTQGTPERVAPAGEGETGGMDSGATGRILDGPQTVPGQLPSLDFNRFMPAAVAAGVVDPERLLNHQAQNEERRLAREQQMQALQMRLADARATVQEKAELQRQLAQMQQEGRMDAIRLAASMRPAPQGPAPTVVQTDNGPMLVDRAGNARPITDPSGNPVKGKSTERALPTSAAQKIFENQQNLRRAEQALALVSGNDVKDENGSVVLKGDANATGYKGFLPDFILQRVDEQGNPARASIADLGSLIIHDRSGAAVTASEYPRLRPFIPLSTDKPQTAALKLKRFTDEYRKIGQEAADFYKESGYKVPTGALQPSGAAPQTGLPSASAIEAELARRKGR